MPDKKKESLADDHADLGGIGCESDSDLEDDIQALDCTAGGIANKSMTFCSGLKNLLIMIMLMYFWCWTSNKRDTALDVLNQMCRNNELNITFYSDALSKVNTWNSKKTLKQVEIN